MSGPMHHLYHKKGGKSTIKVTSLAGRVFEQIGFVTVPTEQSSDCPGTGSGKVTVVSREIADMKIESKPSLFRPSVDGHVRLAEHHVIRERTIRKTIVLSANNREMTSLDSLVDSSSVGGMVIKVREVFSNREIAKDANPTDFRHTHSLHKNSEKISRYIYP